MISDNEGSFYMKKLLLLFCSLLLVKLNLKNPQRYTEKLQWYKMYYRDPVMKQCVDKYEVRKYVEDCRCV